MGIYLLFPNPCTPSHQTTLVENRQEGKGNGIPNHVSTQGFETLFFFFPFIISFSIFSRMVLWRTLCLQSNIEEVLSLSLYFPISSLWFWNSSSFLSSFSFF